MIPVVREPLGSERPVRAGEADSNAAHRQPTPFPSRADRYVLNGSVLGLVATLPHGSAAARDRYARHSEAEAW